MAPRPCARCYARQASVLYVACTFRYGSLETTTYDEPSGCGPVVRSVLAQLGQELDFRTILRSVVLWPRETSGSTEGRRLAHNRELSPFGRPSAMPGRTARPHERGVSVIVFDTLTTVRGMSLSD